MKRGLAQAKGQKSKCDALFSKIVRARGKCERCGRLSGTEQCAHIVSRRYSNTRCDEQNAWCLCARCHLELTGDPYAHVEFAIQTRGEDGYRELRERALSTEKADWGLVLVRLQTRWAQIEAHR